MDLENASMTFQELEVLTADKELPYTHGNSTIEFGTDRWSYEELSWEHHYFKITTHRPDGYVHHRFFFENGHRTEFYTI